MARIACDTETAQCTTRKPLFKSIILDQPQYEYNVLNPEPQERNTKLNCKYSVIYVYICFYLYISFFPTCFKYNSLTRKTIDITESLKTQIFVLVISKCFLRAVFSTIINFFKWKGGGGGSNSLILHTLFLSIFIMGPTSFCLINPFQC